MLKKIFIVAAFSLMLIAPFHVYASISDLIIVCKGAPDPGQTTTPANHECGFADIIKLANGIMTILMFAAIPIASISAVVAGVKILFNPGNMSKIKEGKQLLLRVVIGFCIVFFAYILVYTLTHYLLNPCFNQFLDSTGAQGCNTASG